MALQISTNTAAARASYYLGHNQHRLQQAFDRLASGKKLTSPVEDPGSLAVSMKLSAAVNRLAGAQNNAQNAISFLEVQDGMLESVGKIIDRMSELKGLASQDPMKSEMDRYSYNNEFKDLQVQLYSISQQKFNGVSLFASATTEGTVAQFTGMAWNTSNDNTISIHTSADGSSGSKVSIHRSLLLSALTIHTTLPKSNGQPNYNLDETADRSFSSITADPYNNSDANLQTVMSGSWGRANNSAFNELPVPGPGRLAEGYISFASETVEDALNLEAISVNVIAQALEHISFLRAQNGGSASRLNFAAESLAHQKTNMKAALGRMVDADIAEETTKLSKYQVLSQAAASMLTQANANTDIALMLLR
jgi:flagellin